MWGGDEVDCNQSSSTYEVGLLSRSATALEISCNCDVNWSTIVSIRQKNIMKYNYMQIKGNRRSVNDLGRITVRLQNLFVRMVKGTHPYMISGLKREFTYLGFSRDAEKKDLLFL